MPQVVSEHKSLAELYGQLLRDRREIEVVEADGLSICVHCQGKKSAHLPDLRCSSFCGSREFLSGRDTESKAIERALVLTEELIGLKY